MQRVGNVLRSWSFARVLLICVAWIVLCVLAAAAWLLVQFRGLLAASSGSGGIGAVSVGLSDLILAIPVLPPMILIVAWLIARRRTYTS